MKKINVLKILIIVLGVIGIIIFTVLLVLKNINKTKDTNSNNNIDNQIKIYNTDETNEEDIKKTQYIDDNPIKIGLYVREGNFKKLVKNEYYCGWAPEEILGIFYAVYTNEETISGSNFNIVWKDYLNKYENIDKYRVGYNIKFTMDNGEVIDQTILNPDHAYLMYPEIQFYLYDDINLIPGKRYYHITSEEMNENTICSIIGIISENKKSNIMSRCIILPKKSMKNNYHQKW